MEEHQIKELSVKTRESIFVIFNKFKYIEIDYEEINMMASQTPSDPQSQFIDSSVTPGGEEHHGRQRRATRSPTIIFDKLLSEVELNKVKDKFKQDIETCLEEALRKHVSTF